MTASTLLQIRQASARMDRGQGVDGNGHSEKEPGCRGKVGRVDMVLNLILLSRIRSYPKSYPLNLILFL